MEKSKGHEYSLGFTNEDIEKFLLAPLQEDPRFFVEVEREGGEKVRSYIETKSRSPYSPQKPPNLSDEEYFNQMQKELGEMDRYCRDDQITTVYFQNPKTFKTDEDWFYMEFYADYIAKLYFLNNDFVFTNEEVRKISSGVAETYGSLTYEGGLHGKTSGEILTIMKKLAQILVGATKLKRQNFDIPQKDGIYERQYGFRIDLYYPKGIKPEMSEDVLDNYHFYFHNLE